MNGEQQAGASVLVPGNHDGVHLGHQALLRGARTLAQQDGLRVTALTFSPHPAAVLSPERAPTPLTTIERRIQLLRCAGADQVLVQPFDRAFAALPPGQFLAQLQALGARGIVVGPDFRFGKDRAGDIPSLHAFARDAELQIRVEPPVMLDGERVSSSAVRQAIASGDVERATRLLGHVHDLAGEVVEGDRRGRTLGFPTANLRCEAVLSPTDGVYAVVARVLDRDTNGTPSQSASGLLLGVANLGQRPTFGAGRAIEVHLLDFSGELYGRNLRVGFAARLRAEMRFSGVDALKAQIEVDCRAARDTLAASDRGSWAWI
jgi:riboflavin kinase/FMN adenylyltransferase